MCVHLGEAGLIVQYAENAVWSGGNQLYTGVEVLEWHWIPLDLFCTVLLLHNTHTVKLQTTLMIFFG